MTTSEALTVAMAAITAMKQQAIADKEVYTREKLVPALRELEKESGIQCAILSDPEGIHFDEDRPDNKFNEALDILQNAFNEFEAFEDDHGEEEVWQLNSADLLD